MFEGLDGMRYRLARDGIVDVWPAGWPGWSFVQLSCGRADLPLLLRMRGVANLPGQGGVPIPSRQSPSEGRG